MKKYLYLAALAAATLSSCSSEENPATSQEDVKGLEPIELSVSYSSVKVETRGTGTVGAIADADNKFQYENIYVLMTNVPQNDEEWGYTNAGGTSVGSILGEQFDNSFFCRPEAAGGGWNLNFLGSSVVGKEWGTQGVMRYYPAGGYSEFYAYYIDDAAVSTNLVKNTADETMTIDVTLDGTQDIMAGKAVNPDPTVRGFSAKTARADLVPNLTLKHVLTRFTFEVESGNDNAENMTIDKIEVKSKNKGTLLVAYNEAAAKEAKDLLTIDNTSSAVFELMNPAASAATLEDGKSPLTPFTPLTMGKTTDPAGDQQAGEAMFVMPGETEYEMTIYMTQQAKNGATLQPESQSATRMITLGSGDAFKPGFSYHVKVIVYGLSEVKVNAVLEPWQDGGEIEIDTED